jgi:hypothetical protein
MSLEPRPCHHCGTSVGDSPHRIVLQGWADDHYLPLCRSCQALRQSGQLPADLLVQQWVFARSGPAVAGNEVEQVLVRLECLGCGDALALAFADASAGAPSINAQRLPDGSLTTECATCQRTNLLARRGPQMVAVRLW